MADKTPAQLATVASIAVPNSDLVLVWINADSVLKAMTFTNFMAAVQAELGDDLLLVANNLSDLANAAAARSNLGLGTAAVLASSALFQVANNLSEVSNAATARTNLGAAASASPTITGGMTLTGPIKGNVQALAGTEIDVSLAECFTKSISSNTTFTFTGATASKFQGFILELTISSAAVPTFPASVQWSGSAEPSPGNGKHEFGFFTTDGGTSWVGFLGPSTIG